MHQSKFRQFKGNSYIELPEWISRKKAIVNIQNRDEKCFMWSLLSTLHLVDTHPERITYYKNYYY